MKAFGALPGRTVILRREAGEVVHEIPVELRPWAIGFPEMLDRVFPQPARFENGKPVPDPTKAAEHHACRLMILLAVCMGDGLEVKPPGKDADRGAWAAYAEAVRAEFEAANLVEGDVSLLIAEAYKLNNGHSRPKA